MKLIVEIDNLHDFAFLFDIHVLNFLQIKAIYDFYVIKKILIDIFSDVTAKSKLSIFKGASASWAIKTKQ
jgi:hypothetical protein